MTALEDAPAHWTRTTIGEVADVRLGRQRSPKNHSGTHMRRYLRAANVDWYRLRLDDVREMNFTDDEMDTYRVQDGDILVVEGSGSAGEVGKCAVYRGQAGEVAFQNTLIRIRPHDGVDARWLMYRINAEAELGGFLRLARGVGIFHLGAKRTAQWPLAVPPLDEQRRTVEAIERSLSKIAEARGCIESSGQRLDLLAASVNGHAMYGRLHGVRGDSVDALAIVEAARHGRDPDRILRGEIPPVEVPGTWAWSSIDELADVQSGAAKSRKLVGAEGCVERPYLSVANVQRGRLDLSEVKTMWVRESKLDVLTLRRGDVLFNEGGDKDKLGRGWVWSGEIEGCIHQNHVFRARLRVGGVDPRWVSHWGNVFGQWWFHARGSQTTGIASINKTVLRSLPVPVPPPEEQQAILQELERRSASVRHLAGALNAAAVQSLSLRRAVLGAAFTGRLHNTEVDAELSELAEEEVA